MESQDSKKNVQKITNSLLKQLQKLKNAIKLDKLENIYSNPSDFLIESINIKKKMDFLARTYYDVEKIIDLKQKKFEKKKLYLEGLEYYHSLLQKQIQREYFIQVQKIDCQLDEEVKESNWIEDFEENIRKVERKHKKLQMGKIYYSQKLETKDKLQRQLFELKEKLQSKSLSPSRMETIQNQINYLSRKLDLPIIRKQKAADEKLNNIFQKLKDLEKQERFLVEIVKKKVQYLKVTFKELRFEEDQEFFDFKGKDHVIIIVKLEKLGLLSFGVQKYNHNCACMDLFNRLVDNQVLKNSSTTQQYEFTYMKWMEDMVLSSKKQLQEIFKKLRKRIFCHQLKQFILQKIKDKVTELKVLSFQKYLYIPSIFVPPRITKYIEELSLIKKQRTKYLEKAKTLEKSFFSLSLEDLLYPNFNKFYQIIIKHEELYFQIIFIIPYEYPLVKSKIKIVDIQSCNQFFGKKNSLKKTAKVIERFSKKIPQIQREVNEIMRDKTQNCSILQLHYQFQKLFQIFYT